MLAIFMFVFGSNLDSFVLGLSYGVKKIKIPIGSNLLVSAMTFAGTMVSIIAGGYLAAYMPDLMAECIGGSILIVMGLISIRKHIRGRIKEEEDPWSMKNAEKYDENGNHHIEMKEALFLGFALSVNNIGLGIGAGIAGLNAGVAAVCSLAVSIVCLGIGNRLGFNCLSRLLGKKADLISGAIMIGLGALEMLQSL